VIGRLEDGIVRPPALRSTNRKVGAVRRRRLVDPPLEPRRHERDHDRHEVDGALVPDHMDSLALRDWPDVDHYLSPDGASIAISYGDILGGHALSVRDVATGNELFAVDEDA
jgi:hypothetical protein